MISYAACCMTAEKPQHHRLAQLLAEAAPAFSGVLEPLRVELLDYIEADMVAREMLARTRAGTPAEREVALPGHRRAEKHRMAVRRAIADKLQRLPDGTAAAAAWSYVEQTLEALAQRSQSADGLRTILPTAAPLSDPREPVVPISPVGKSSKTKLFISHASKDKALAGALVTYIQDCVAERDLAIRYTSDEEFGFAPGTLAAQLRGDILACDYFIVLATPESVKTEWVIFEMGACWVSGEGRVVPVIHPDHDYKILPGLLGSPQAKSIRDEEYMLHVLQELGMATGWHLLDHLKVKKAWSKLARFVSDLKPTPPTPVAAAPTPAPTPVPPAPTLKALSHDEVGMIHSTFNDFLNNPRGSAADLVHQLQRYPDSAGVLRVLVIRVRKLIQDMCEQAEADDIGDDVADTRRRRMKHLLSVFAREIPAEANVVFGEQAMSLLNDRVRLGQRFGDVLLRASWVIDEAWLDSCGDASKEAMEMLAEHYPRFWESDVHSRILGAVEEEPDDPDGDGYAGR